MGLSVAIAIIGISLARYFYHIKPEIPDRIEATLKPLHGLLYNKWYVDELYDFLFVNGLCKGGGTLLGAFDRNVVDGGVNGAGWLTRFTAQGFDVVGHLDHRRRGALRLVLREDALLPGLHLLQSGRVQAYAFFVVVGALAFLGYYVAR